MLVVRLCTSAPLLQSVVVLLKSCEFVLQCSVLFFGSSVDDDQLVYLLYGLLILLVGNCCLVALGEGGARLHACRLLSSK